MCCRRCCARQHAEPSNGTQEPTDVPTPCFLSILTLADAGCASTGGGAAGDAGPLVPAKQGSFFVGGRNIQSDDLSLLPAYVPSGPITVDQMYVRYRVPMNAEGTKPVVFVHGCCLTGKTWEETAGGRLGRDEPFARRGRPTYVVEPALGRCPARFASGPASRRSVWAAAIAPGSAPDRYPDAVVRHAHLDPAAVGSRRCELDPDLPSQLHRAPKCLLQA